MPKAAVDKDHLTLAGKYQIWVAGQIFSVEAKSEAQRMGESPNRHFRFHALASDGAHIGAALLPSDAVNHHESQRFCRFKDSLTPKTNRNIRGTDEFLNRARRNVQHCDAACGIGDLLLWNGWRNRTGVAMPAKKLRFSVNLTENEAAELQRVAAGSDVSCSWVARQAIIEFLGRNTDAQGALPLPIKKGTRHDAS